MVTKRASGTPRKPVQSRVLKNIEILNHQMATAGLRFSGKKVFSKSISGNFMFNKSLFCTGHEWFQIVANYYICLCYQINTFCYFWIPLTETWPFFINREAVLRNAPSGNWYLEAVFTEAWPLPSLRPKPGPQWGPASIISEDRILALKLLPEHVPREAPLPGEKRLNGKHWMLFFQGQKTFRY